MSDDDDFYVEDEPIEEVRAAWKRGEKGETTGKKDLNERAKSIADRAVARLESDQPLIRLTVVHGSASLTKHVDETSDDESPVQRVNVKEIEYQVG